MKQELDFGSNSLSKRLNIKANYLPIGRQVDFNHERNEKYEKGEKNHR